MADLFVGIVSGLMHVYHIMIFKPGRIRRAKIHCHACFWRACLPLVLCLASHCYSWNGSMGPFFRSEKFNVGLSLLQGCCLHLVHSCHLSIRRRGVIPDCTKSQPIRLGFAHNSCAFHRHCLLCNNCSNIKRKAPPYSSGAMSSDRKLTVTMLVVIFLSTVAFLPYFLDAVLEISIKLRGLSDEAQFNIQESFNVFFYANSFVNPLVCTLKMKEFRKATRVWCSSANTISWSQMIELNEMTE